MSEDKKERKKLEAISRYWDSRAEGYSLQVDKEFRDGPQEKYLGAFSVLPAGARVLDAGCGPGFFSTLLARAGFNVCACDASQGMLEKVRARALAAGITVETHQADVQALDFAEASFDCVCSRNLVWNLEEPERAYREWLRVLEPGGLLVVFDGNHYNYLFDERYRRVHIDGQQKADHRFLDVDPSVIDRIAEELPLSRVLRPAWDEKILGELGAVDICSSTLSEFTDPVGGQKLTGDFMLCARKGGCRSVES